MDTSPGVSIDSIDRRPISARISNQRICWPALIETRVEHYIQRRPAGFLSYKLKSSFYFAHAPFFCRQLNLLSWHLSSHESGFSWTSLLSSRTPTKTFSGRDFVRGETSLSYKQTISAATLIIKVIQDAPLPSTRLQLRLHENNVSSCSTAFVLNAATEANYHPTLSCR